VLLGILVVNGCTSCGPGEPEVEPAVYAGESVTCVVLDGSRLRCWGRNESGDLGMGIDPELQEFVGDDEIASSVEAVELPIAVRSASVGHTPSCALLADGAVRCWGGGAWLGYLGFPGAPGQGIGDDETLAEGPAADLGEPALQVAVGGHHACVRLEEGRVKCFGAAGNGETGYGTTELLGDEADEIPAKLPAVELGGPAIHVAAGLEMSCATLEGGSVRCWGYDGAGRLGLAQGYDENGAPIVIGDDEVPASVPAIRLPEPAVAVTSPATHLCALHESGRVTCWGEPGPWLGYGERLLEVGEGYGDDEHPDVLGTVDIGETVVELGVGAHFTCARLESGAVKCWGSPRYGATGSGEQKYLGYRQTPAEIDPVALGGKAVGLAVGWNHACAMLEGGTLRCWGYAGTGALGHGNTEDIGDDEKPVDVEPVPYR
jgi:hypothetical protein